MPLQNVSIVVIGYNEEKNLDKTFQAIENINYPCEKLELIYVDSGSKDRSVEIARKYTENIFIEEKFPSPGRNRNRGLVEAQHDIVHFIDGDVVIDAGYLKNIVNLFDEKNVQAIVGQLEEQNPIFLNKLAALTNNEKKEGYIEFTSTGGTYQKAALLSVNGYDERIKRGEETELGLRFNRAGYKIWCSNYKMGSHDYRIYSIWQYVQKYKINARAQVQAAFIKDSNSFYNAAKKRFTNQLIKLTVTPIVLILCIMSGVWWGIPIFLVLSCLNRNKWIIKRYIRSNPILLCCDLSINFFFYWLWWYGFLCEIFKYFFQKQMKTFYSLEKVKLVDK